MIHNAALDEAPDDLDDDPLSPFIAEGLITEVLGEIKSGKEGTVYCCRANPSLGHELIAAKVYRERSHRTFKNDSRYREGRVILNKRDARAVNKNTEWGREARFGMWIEHEYQTLKQLSELGADVPKPLVRGGRAVLMEYVGDEHGAAPALQQVALPENDVRPLFQSAVSNLELFLRCNLIHGDLSAYNILYRPGRITIIDFPQAVDPRSNSAALSLLARDVENLCSYWTRYGVRADPGRMTHHLWSRFLRSEL